VEGAAFIMSAPEEPLIPTTSRRSKNDAVVARSDGNSANKEDGIEQTLGGKTYTINTSELAIRRAERHKMPFWKRFLQSGALLLATPALIPTAALYVVSMYIGPTWYRNKMAYIMIRYDLL
jgi:hypothetical protein